jgi:hypothetical protein
MILSVLELLALTFQEQPLSQPVAQSVLGLTHRLEDADSVMDLARLAEEQQPHVLIVSRINQFLPSRNVFATSGSEPVTFVLKDSLKFKPTMGAELAQTTL